MSLCHDELVITILVFVDILLVGIDQLQNAKENMQFWHFWNVAVSVAAQI